MTSQKYSGPIFARARLARTLFAFCFLSGAGVAKSVDAQRAAEALPANEAQAELQKRIAAAEAARASRDAEAVKRANEKVIALALRELAQLRLLEGAYPQAVNSYKHSLEFEDVPAARVDLAIAQIGANMPEEAISEAERAIVNDPNDLRALSVLGRGWMLKKGYARAAGYLGRVAQLRPSVDSDYAWATCLLATRKPEDQAKATQIFAEMLKRYGDSGSLHVLFGRAYRDAADMPAAVKEFQRAIELEPRTPHAHYFLGLARLSMNEWAPTPEARAEFVKELEFYPRDYLANYMLGFVDSSVRNYREANPRLKLAAELNPRSPEPPLYLGLNAYAEGNMKLAEESLQKAIELTGTDESRSVYQIRRAYVTLGRILVNSGREAEGQRYLAKGRELQNKALALNQREIGSKLLEGGAGAAAVVLPVDTDAERQAAPLGTAAANPFGPVDPSTLAASSLTEEQKKQADRLEKSLRTVLGASFSEIGTGDAMQKLYALALTQFQEAERWDPGLPGLYRNLGVAAYRAGDYGEAIRALKLALEEKPNDAPLVAMLGLAYYASDHAVEATKTFEPLGDAGMRDPLVGYAWAASLAKLGDLKQAALVLAEAEKNVLPAETDLLVGQLWITIEDYARAVAAVERALSENPRIARAHYFLGLAYLRWDKHPEAIAEFQREIAANPSDFEAKDNLGFLYLEQSRTEEATALFQSVLDAHPDDATANYQLGKILLDKGQTAEAIAHLEKAAKMDPEKDYIHYQLQAAYRKDSRTADADRELQIYKEIKARKRASVAPSSPDRNP